MEVEQDSLEKIAKEMIKSYDINTVAFPLTKFIERLKKLVK